MPPSSGTNTPLGLLGSEDRGNHASKTLISVNHGNLKFVAVLMTIQIFWDVTSRQQFESEDGGNMVPCKIGNYQQT